MWACEQKDASRVAGGYHPAARGGGPGGKAPQFRLDSAPLQGGGDRVGVLFDVGLVRREVGQREELAQLRQDRGFVRGAIGAHLFPDGGRAGVGRRRRLRGKRQSEEKRGENRSTFHEVVSGGGQEAGDSGASRRPARNAAAASSTSARSMSPETWSGTARC